MIALAPNQSPNDSMGWSCPDYAELRMDGATPG